MVNVQYLVQFTPSGNKFSGSRNYIQDPGDAQLIVDGILWMKDNEHLIGEQGKFMVHVTRQVVTRVTFNVDVPKDQPRPIAG